MIALEDADNTAAAEGISYGPIISVITCSKYHIGSHRGWSQAQMS